MEQNVEQQVTRGLAQTTTKPAAYVAPPQPKSYPFATEVISLPSKGLVYPESNPLSKGEITF